MFAQYQKSEKRHVRKPATKGLIALFFFLLPALVFAELRYLGDSELAVITGKKGLTIDIETEVTIAEFEYVDGGTFYIKDISLSGIGGGLADNIRATVDLSDGAETLKVGFADYAMLASMGYLDASETDVAWAIAQYSDGFGGFGKTFGDGDLAIHVTSTDYGGIDFNSPPNPVDHVANLHNLKNAVDLHFQEGEIGLRSSDGLVETALSKNFSAEAYLGYLDIVFKNRGNGFRATLASNPGEPQDIEILESYIGMDIKFRVEDLDIDQTNNATNTFVSRRVTNTHLVLRDMRIHNERGDDTLGSFGFASVESKIAAAKGILPILGTPGMTRVDGQAVYDINVKWDWDLPDISFGDTFTSIGEVYFTDFHIDNTSLVISAH